MFITKKHLSRRTLLKGAGFSLALPLLDAMIPAGAALAQTAAARKLLVGFFYLPHGAIMDNTSHGPAMDRWTPRGSGPDFRLNAITASLEPYKKYVTSFGNIKNDAPNGTQHVMNAATWLSGVKPDLPGPKMSATLDQVIAKQVGGQTPLPSLEVSSETTAQQRAGNGPYTTLSFRDATTPLKTEYNPRQVFIKLFGADKDLAAKKKIENEETSLLDLIKEQTLALQRDLDPRDRAVLDSHLTAVREAEQRLASSKQNTQNIERVLGSNEWPPVPTGVQDDFDKQVKLMFDLITIAYRADLTRVASFIMAAEGTNQTYNHIGVPESFHPVSHHANDLGRIAQLVKIQTWHMERFAEFLGKLAAIPDGEGTLLDNAMFLYGSNMSNSDRHDTHPLPTLLIGGGAGKLTGGRHIALPTPTPISNLHLSLLDRVGIEQRTFGDSTGTIDL
jgi:hypothetical protein